MEIYWGEAVLAGVVGAALMAVAMLAGKVMGLATDIIRVIGLFFFAPEASKALIYGVGLVVHFAVGAVFGIVYAILFTAVGVQNVIGLAGLWGILFGVLHAMVIGALAGILPAVHPRMSTGGGPGELRAPGVFGRNIGVAMPVALILLHVIYGVTAGLFYSVGVVGG